MNLSSALSQRERMSLRKNKRRACQPGLECLEERLVMNCDANICIDSLAPEDAPTVVAVRVDDGELRIYGDYHSSAITIRPEANQVNTYRIESADPDTYLARGRWSELTDTIQAVKRGEPAGFHSLVVSGVTKGVNMDLEGGRDRVTFLGGNFNGDFKIDDVVEVRLENVSVRGCTEIHPVVYGKLESLDILGSIFVGEVNIDMEDADITIRDSTFGNRVELQTNDHRQTQLEISDSTFLTLDIEHGINVGGPNDGYFIVMNNVNVVDATYIEIHNNGSYNGGEGGVYIDNGEFGGRFEIALDTFLEDLHISNSHFDEEVLLNANFAPHNLTITSTVFARNVSLRNAGSAYVDQITIDDSHFYASLDVRWITSQIELRNSSFVSFFVETFDLEGSSDTVHIEGSEFYFANIQLQDGDDNVYLRNSTFWGELELDGGGGFDLYFLEGGNEFHGHLDLDSISQGGLATSANAGLRPDVYSGLDAATGELTITSGASDSSDTVTVYRSGSDLAVTTVAGENTYHYRFAFDQIQSITISTGGGNDTVNLESLPSVLTIVDTGAGNDTIDVSRTTSNLANVAGANLVVSSTGGFDRLNVYDRLGVGGTYTVRSTTSTMIVDTPSLTITGSGLDQIQLDTSDRSDRVYVRSKHAGTHVIVNAGNGDDWFFLGSTSATLQPVQGTLHLNGESGYDRHYLYDYGTNQARTYDVTSNRIVHALSSNLQQTSTITHYMEQTYVIAGAGNDTFRVNSSWIASPVSVYGKAGNDTVIGANAANTWDVTGYNSGKLNNMVGFNQVERLTGNRRSDTFRMNRYGSVSGRIDGGAGSDTVDYSSFTSPVRVDLGWGTATNVGRGMWFSISGIENAIGGARDDVLIGSSGNNILRGGAGDDQLYGQSGHDVLLGGWGMDKLYGSSGRDLLIGGTGADTLDGGYDDDILIAGSTAYDSNDWALSRLLAEWTSGRTYDQRVSNIQGGYGSTYGYHLASDTVFKDSSIDSLTGGSQRDWFWSDPLRYVPNPTPTFGVGLAGGKWVFDWLNDWVSRNEVRSYSS